MIDRAEFAKVMGVFADRIGRPLAPATSDAYLETLSEALTTDEFLAGARIVFRAHQFNTWPAPQQFIDAVKPQPPVALEAAEAFTAVVQAVGSMYDDHAVRAERMKALGPVAERAYRAAGGYRDFVSVLESELPFLRRRFVEAYQDAKMSDQQLTDALTALNRGALDPRIAGLVEGTAKVLSIAGRDRALPRGDR